MRLRSQSLFLSLIENYMTRILQIMLPFNGNGWGRGVYVLELTWFLTLTFTSSLKRWQWKWQISYFSLQVRISVPVYDLMVTMTKFLWNVWFPVANQKSCGGGGQQSWRIRINFRPYLLLFSFYLFFGRREKSSTFPSVYRTKT